MLARVCYACLLRRGHASFGLTAAESWLAFMLPFYAGARRVFNRAEAKKDVLMWEALRMATDEEMEKDPTVCVMGTHLAACPGMTAAP